MAEAAVSGVGTFEGVIHGDIKITQENVNSRVEVGGQLSGLDEGQYIMLLVSLSPAAFCDNVAGYVRLGELTQWDQGQGETVDLGAMAGEAIVAGEDPRQERKVTLATDDVVGLVVRDCPVGSNGYDCDKGAVKACAKVEWPDHRGPGGVTTGLSWQMLIIIAVAVLIFFIVLITIPLICCCIKRYNRTLKCKCNVLLNADQHYLLFRHRRKNLTTETDLEDEYEDRSKSPMFDELSLPFIDQSLPPTPKVGRVVNGLDILLGHSVSENSLVGESWSIHNMYIFKGH